MSYVRDALSGKIQVDLDRGQRHALDVLLTECDDPSRREELASGFREVFQDPDPKLRAAALRFFLACDVDDEGLLLDAYRNRMAEFEGKRETWFPDGPDQGDLLVLAISGRMQQGSEELELIKAEALRPVRGGYTIAGLMRVDPSWLLQNVVKIISKNPDALRAVLFGAIMNGLDPDEYILRLKGSVPDETLLETSCSVIPKQFLHFHTLLEGETEEQDRKPEILEGMRAPSADERIANIGYAGAHPELVDTLCNLHVSSLAGCEDIAAVLPEQLAGMGESFWAELAMKKAIVAALSRIGQTETGVLSLLRALCNLLGDYHRAAYDALLEVDPGFVAGVVSNMLTTRRADMELALHAMSVLAIDFHGVQESRRIHFKQDPKPLPELLVWIGDEHRALLEGIAKGSDLHASRASSLLDVLEEFRPDQP